MGWILIPDSGGDLCALHSTDFLCEPGLSALSGGTLLLSLWWQSSLISQQVSRIMTAPFWTIPTFLMSSEWAWTAAPHPPVRHWQTLLMCWAHMCKAHHTSRSSTQVEPQGVHLGAVTIPGAFSSIRGSNILDFSIFWQPAMARPGICFFIKQANKWCCTAKSVLLSILWLYQPVLTQPNIFTWNNGMSFAKFPPPFFLYFKWLSSQVHFLSCLSSSLKYIIPLIRSQ